MSQSIVSAGKVFAGAAAVTLSMLSAVPTTASAAVVSITNPGGSGVIGARIRWGGTGFEAAIRSTVYCAPSNVCGPQLNPAGTPVWSVGTDYAFKVEYKTDGSLYLGVDFNGANGIEATEAITHSFGALNGQGFDFLQIFGNDGSSTAESQVSDLLINGTSIGTLASGLGASTDTFYNDTGGGATPWLITGNLRFLTAGTSGENPSWNFNLRSPGTPDPTPVSEPGTLALGALALLALGAVRRRNTV
jgi:MYXO-CTERM domain-containing protein